MSRRDTIIVAVLVNAALLMVLFATALRSDPEKDQSRSPTQLAQATPNDAPPKEDLLNQYITAVPTHSDTEPTQAGLSPLEEDVPIAFTPVDVPVVREAPAVPKREDAYTRITVKQGDFLEKIAKANNTTVSKIMQMNNLATTQLKIGQILKVPLNGNTSTPPTKSVPSAADYYIVQEGDSPWLIANRNNIKLSDLLRLNDLDEQKARRIRPGDKLRIR